MSDAFFEAFVIMVTGIGTVFAFLLLLLAAMQILQRLTAPLAVKSALGADATTANPIPSNAIAASTVAAITVAVKHYRRSHQQEGVRG